MTDQRIAFICDRHKCKNCNPDCLHTTDIKHAAYCVRRLAPDTWFESKPTVDAKPVRHGKWIEQWRTTDTRMLRCSECKMVFNVGNGRDGNYCPNCGARMDAERKYNA